MVDFLNGQPGVHVQKTVAQEARIGHVTAIILNQNMAELIVMETEHKKNFATLIAVQVCSLKYYIYDVNANFWLYDKFLWFRFCLTSQ